MRWFFAAMLLLVAPGCGAALVLRREVPRPAEIPARAFPVVYVAASPDDPSREAAAAIAEHLSGGETRVVRTEPAQLLGEASTEPLPTLALLVTMTLGEDVRTEMSMPTARCQPGATCYGYAERFPIDVPVQVGQLVVRAFDPRSASELGHAVLREEEREPSPLAARLAVIDRLRAAAVALFDVHAVAIDLELDAVDDDVGRAAVEDARAGRIHTARLALEARALASDVVAAQRAAMLFDLGQLMRVDVDVTASDAITEETSRSLAAEARILEAIQLAPTERHERALTQLRAERTAREDVRAQEAAADLNFATGAPP